MATVHTGGAATARSESKRMLKDGSIACSNNNVDQLGSLSPSSSSVSSSCRPALRAWKGLRSLSLGSAPTTRLTAAAAPAAAASSSSALSAASTCASSRV